MLRGGCLCGKIRYEGRGRPFNATFCHCILCRRSAGAPFVAWFSLRRAEFRVTAGELAHFASSEAGRRGFCRDCGTQLTFTDRGLPDELDITTASLDDPEAVPPRDHSWTQSRIGWVRTCDGLPEHRTRRADG